MVTTFEELQPNLKINLKPLKKNLYIHSSLEISLQGPLNEQLAHIEANTKDQKRNRRTILPLITKHQLPLFPRKNVTGGQISRRAALLGGMNSIMLYLLLDQRSHDHQAYSELSSSHGRRSLNVFTVFDLLHPVGTPGTPAYTYVASTIWYTDVKCAMLIVITLVKGVLFFIITRM